MKLLIVAATQQELAQTFQHFGLATGEFVAQPTFDILIAGVGMTATAFALGQHLDQKYNLVLNVGIAGSFDPQLELGSLVNIETDIFSELGAEDHDSFLTIDELGFGTNMFQSNYAFNELPKVKGITVNKVHGNQESIDQVKKRFNPQTESMEGAAVFYACAQFNIQRLQIRSISNYVEPRNKESWKIGLAIKNLNEWLIGYLNSRM